MNKGTQMVTTARNLLVVAGLLAGGAGAADKGWDNGADNLSWDTTSANWNGTTWSEGDNAFFTNANAAAKGQITLDGTRQVRNITVSQNGYSFTGGGIQNAAADQINDWSIANGVTVTNASPLNISFTTVDGKIRRASGSGTGRWVQTGPVVANGVGNGFEVHGGGWLELTGNSAWTNVALNPFYQGGAATVLISGGTHTFAGTAGKKGITCAGGGKFILNGGSVETIAGVVASGSNGDWTINGGELAVTGGNTLNWSGTSNPNQLSGRVYLNGGVLKATAIAGAPYTSYHYLYLNGGTFEAAADRTPNIFDLGVNALSRIWVQAGGAVIDTAGYAVTQSQPLIREGTTTGGLTKKGAGTLTLAGTNTYAGATTVTGGTLALGTARALVPEMTVTLSDATYDLCGFTVTNGTVTVTDGSVANGTLAASSFAATGTCAVSASLAGSGSVTKGGAGILSLANRHTFSGPLTVSGGELRVAEDSPAGGSALWLDAAYAPSLAVDGGGTGGTPAPGGLVGRWTSRSGDNYASQATGWQPTYETNVLNGLPVVRIPRSKILTLKESIPASTATVFAVYASISNDVNWASAFGNNLMMVTGPSDLKRTLSVSPPLWIHSTEPVSEWAVQTMELQAGGACRLWVNESGYGPGTMTGTSVTPFKNIGNWRNFAFAEVLIYTNLLSEADRLQTVRYLRQKWFSTAGTPNRLATALPVTVKAGATLNLNGCAQSVASLSGAGTVTGAAVGVTSRLSPGDSGDAAGTLTVDGDLTLAAGATNAVDFVAGTGDTVTVGGTLSFEGSVTIEVSLNGQIPSAQWTLFTAGDIQGDAYLETSTVVGEGLEGYRARVVRDGNEVVLRILPFGTVILIR